MPDKDPRPILEEYVSNGKVMELATLRPEGPWMSPVWYNPSFNPDRLYFMSNISRKHSRYIEQDNRVAGAILAIDLDQLGQPVRGVMFTGTAAVVPTSRAEGPIQAFTRRWPNATKAISMELLERDETPNRLYEVVVQEWVLHDEVNFPENPQHQIVPL